VCLSVESEVSFTVPDWKFSVASLNFKLSSLKLLYADGLYLLRGGDGDIGIAFNKYSSQHFFFFGKSSSALLHLR
jgi:hypothetical protein